MAGRLDLTVSIATGVWHAEVPDVEAIGRRAAQAAFAAAAPSSSLAGVEASLILCDDGELHRLNNDYRGVDKATNVLAFPAMAVNTEPAPDDATRIGETASDRLPQVLGDIFIAFATAAAEAADQGKTLGDHLSHLVVHGMLHLLGYDHVASAEAERMEELEVAVLAGLGIADPYAMTSL